MSDLVQINPDLKREINKYLKTISHNLKQKQRFRHELEGMLRTSHMSLGKNGLGITLFGDEVKQYKSIVEKLALTYPKSKNYDKKYAEKVLRDAIWIVVESENDIKISCPKAIDHIEQSYKLVISNWTIYFPVSGIEFLKGTLWSFGRVNFIKQNNRNFKSLLANNIIVNSDPQILSTTHFLQIKVSAVDHDSAIKIAKPTADLHIAVLNALSNIGGSSKHNSTFSSYMGIGETLHSKVLVERSNRVGWSRCMTLNLAGFNPHLFKSSEFIRRFGRMKLSRELTSMDNSLFLKRLFPSIKWFGKAITQSSNEEVFLYYCLAFEAIMFEEKFDDKLMESLRKRAFRLLFTVGNYLGSSVESINEFNRLYKIRSAIVHRGGIDVSDSDILVMRNLVLGCYYKFFYTRSLSRIKTSEQLEIWLDK